MITTHLTGHMYRNSPYETDSSCGNCNGQDAKPAPKYSKSMDSIINLILLIMQKDTKNQYTH